MNEKLINKLAQQIGAMSVELMHREVLIQDLQEEINELKKQLSSEQPMA